MIHDLRSYLVGGATVERSTIYQSRANQNMRHLGQGSLTTGNWYQLPANSVLHLARCLMSAAFGSLLVTQGAAAQVNAGQSTGGWKAIVASTSSASVAENAASDRPAPRNLQGAKPAGRPSSASRATTNSIVAPALTPEKFEEPPPPPIVQPATVVTSFAGPDYTDAVQRFCTNIGPSAIEARAARQQRLIAELEKEIAARAERLDAKIGEHKAWLGKRQAFATKAAATLVQVITRMRPEAAALQLSEMEEETAAALLLKLDPKIAAPLLSEIPAAKAARLSGLIAAAAEIGARRSELAVPATTPLKTPSPAEEAP